MNDTLNEALSELARRVEVTTLAAVFASAGHDLALVGGTVRDALLGFIADDADFDFTTSADPDTIESLVSHLGPVWTAGKRFGTIAVSLPTLNGETKVEVTTWRTDEYNDTSRKPDVTFATSLEEDLRRRDLAINAMALDLSTGAAVLVDPFNGREDLESKTLRCPGDPDLCFSDDPLRIVRAVRFAAKLDATIEEETFAAAKRQAHRLNIVARERIEAELSKIASCSPLKVATALETLADLGAARWVFALEDGDAIARSLAPAVAVAGPNRGAIHAGIALIAGERSVSGLKLPNDTVRAAIAASRTASLVNGTELDELIPALRKLVRSNAPEAVRLGLDLGRTLKPGNTAHALWLLDGLLEAEKDLPTKPLPVNGFDALELGLKGATIKAALNAVEDVLCRDGVVSRARALDILTSFAS